MVNIKKDQITEHDYNCARSECERLNWHHAIVLDEDGDVYARTVYGGGCPEDEWHGRTICLCSVQDGTASVEPLVEGLEARLGDLEALHRMQRIKWNGHNWVGRLGEPDEDGVEAGIERLEELSEALEDVVLPTYWEARDWLHSGGALEQEDFEAAMGTEAECRAHAQALADQSIMDDTWVDVDELYEALREVREDPVYVAAYLEGLRANEGLDVWWYIDEDEIEARLRLWRDDARAHGDEGLVALLDGVDLRAVACHWAE